MIKQRIARPGQGRSGGYRTIIIFRQGERAFFVYGYAKSKRSNIEQDEVEVFRKAARELLLLSESQLAQLIENEALMEVTGDNEA